MKVLVERNRWDSGFQVNWLKTWVIEMKRLCQKRFAQENSYENMIILVEDKDLRSN